MVGLPSLKRSLGLPLALTAAIVLFAAVLAFLPGGAAATITSAGPLTRIDVSTTQHCQVRDTFSTGGWSGNAGEYFAGSAPGACATAVAVGTTLFAPPNIPAGWGTNSVATNWTPVSQTAVTGTGTATNPFSVTTVTRAGSTGVELSQQDYYVVGEPAYYTAMTVTNNGASGQTIKLFRGSDCYPDGQDFSDGMINVGAGEVACVRPARLPYQILWRTTTLGTVTPNFQEASYGTIWSRIGSQNMFPNTCVCGSVIDSGIGISWQTTLQPGQSFFACIENVFSTATSIQGCVPPIPPTPPTAGFLWSQPDPCYPWIQFVDVSFPFFNDTIVSWEWDFGDGSTGLGPNPVHTYGGPGPWTATLTVEDDDGETNSFSLDVVLCVPPVPQFSYELVSPCDTHSPYVLFKDESYDPDEDGYIIGVHWNFGLGEYSYEHDPYHTWGDLPGQFPVTLTALDNFGTIASITVTVPFPGFVHCDMASGNSQVSGSARPSPSDGHNVTIGGLEDDGDGVAAEKDNCPRFGNTDQKDADLDGLGDACDLDIDNDGRANGADVCPGTFDPDQLDLDQDLVGDACDDDHDNDGVPNVADPCPMLAAVDLVDTDGDGKGDLCTDLDEGTVQQPLAGGASESRVEGSGVVPVKDQARTNWVPIALVSALGLGVLGGLFAVMRRQG